MIPRGGNIIFIFLIGVEFYLILTTFLYFLRDMLCKFILEVLTVWGFVRNFFSGRDLNVLIIVAGVPYCSHIFKIFWQWKIFWIVNINHLVLPMLFCWRMGFVSWRFFFRMKILRCQCFIIIIHCIIPVQNRRHGYYCLYGLIVTRNNLTLNQGATNLLVFKRRLRHICLLVWIRAFRA